MTASTAPALKINLSAWLHHLFSRMFPLCLISIHISAGDSYLRINNNMSSQDILFLILYNLILSIGAAHNTIQEQRHAVVEHVTSGYAPMFPRTFLEESHRNPAAGRERGLLLAFWVLALLSLAQRIFWLEPLSPQLRAVVVPSLKVALLIRTGTGARSGCHLAGEHNLRGAKIFSYEDK